MQLIHLKESTANQIMRRIRDIVKYPINIIDQHGTILASSDTKRVHQRHEGAIIALNENRLVALDDAATQSLKGVKAGVNIPIYYHQKAIGVVGITADPTEILGYSELIKHIAELIIEHVALSEQQQWQKRYKESLVSQLIAPDCDKTSIQSLATYLDINLTLPHFVLIIEFPKVTPERMSDIIDYLDKHHYLFLFSIPNQLILLKPTVQQKSRWQEQLEHKAIQQLHDNLNRFSPNHIIVGHYFPDTSGIYLSYLTAKATLSLVKRQHLPGELIFYHDYMLAALMEGLTDQWQGQQLASYGQRLKKYDSKGMLQHTLHHYFQENSDKTKTAESLNIHRNTLRYRLQKVEQITGLKLDNLSHLLLLYLSFYLLP